VDAISIRTLESAGEMLLLEELQRQVWPGSETEVVPAHMLLSLAHNGGLILGAFDGEALVGFVLGFIGTDAATPARVAMARLKHASHMLGVHPRCRDRSIGYQLKAAQRRVVMAQGIRLMTWTYDPLLSRNAHLNIRRLGAVCRMYIRDAYGQLRDGLNAAVASDRFSVEWWLTSSRVKSRMQGARRPIDLANVLAAGVVKANPATLGEDDLPRPASQFTIPQEAMFLAEIPPDFHALRDADPHLGMAWRQHSRELFESAFTGGFMVTDFIYLKGEKHPRSYYLLSHGESKLG
jgi:predicted GNAT superfamily acetyltransferase